MLSSNRRNPCAAGLAGVLLSGLLAACSEAPPPAEASPRPVRYQKIVEGNPQERVTFAGVAQAGIESRLSFRVGGTIDRVVVQVGDRVRKGQVLARMDPLDLELREQEAAAALAQGQAALRQAEADYERMRALYENNNASKSELDAGRAKAESAQAQVAAGNKQLEQAHQQVAYTVLRAPASGVIAVVEVEVNETVQAGEMICLLTAGAQPEVRVAVAEIMISRIERGQPVTVTLDALPGREFNAAITEVGVTTGSASTFSVTALLEEAAEEIRSGMAADVTFQFADVSGQASLLLPLLSVGEDQQGRFVYVLSPSDGDTGVVSRRAVVVGQLIDGGVQVLSGVEPGELVVTAGVRRLTDGQVVRMLAEDLS